MILVDIGEFVTQPQQYCLASKFWVLSVKGYGRTKTMKDGKKGRKQGKGREEAEAG